MTEKTPSRLYEILCKKAGEQFCLQIGRATIVTLTIESIEPPRASMEYGTQCVTLTQGSTVTVGRAEDRDLQTLGPYTQDVSREHLKLTYNEYGNAIIVEDTSSHKATKIRPVK